MAIFDHITDAQLEASLAAANISSLVRIANAETIDMVLQAAAKPPVQINIPKKYLNPTRAPKPETSKDKRKEKIATHLLPRGDALTICSRPQNIPTKTPHCSHIH